MKVMLAFGIVAVALGQGSVAARQDGALLFVADLRGQLVAPASVDTAATAKATGVLIGHLFTVHGSFTGLSSPLRDLAAKPNDPGVHLHRGAPGLTTPYFHGLQVKLNADGLSGVFYGSVTLSDDQRKALLATEAYVDIHTVKYGPGEVRDQWTPMNAAAAAKLLGAVGGAEPVLHAGACHPTAPPRTSSRD